MADPLTDTSLAFHPQEDYEILTRKDISDCVRQAVMLRLTEKCILGHAQMVAKHTRETLEQAAASGADIVVEMSMREEGEEEEEGSSNECAETECKVRSSGGEASNGSNQLRFMAGGGIEGKALVEKGKEEEEEEEGRETLNSCEKDQDASVGIVEETNHEESPQLHKEAVTDDRVRLTQTAEEEGGPKEREKGSCEETPTLTLVSGDSRKELETDEAASEPEDGLCTQTDPPSQDSLHQAS